MAFRDKKREKEYMRTYMKEYRKEYKEELRQKNIAYYRNNREKVNATAYRCLLKKYGITIEHYNELFNEQGGCCVVCGKHQSELKRRLNVDHNHKTGKVRALLCTKCNVALGNFNDDAELCLNAYNYLRKN